MSPGATIKNVAQAMRIIKRMELGGSGWGEDYRSATKGALVEILQAQMRMRLDRYLEEWGRLEAQDRYNGSYSRQLLTEMGSVEVEVPRTRRVSAMRVVQAYARRSPQVDRMILACFVLGLSTRKVSRALLPVLGEPVSPSTVSRVARLLDGAVAAFHARRLQDHYRVLILDGVVLAQRTGMGASRRPVLVALGITPDGKKEIIDFRLAEGESAIAWEAFLTDLYNRGLEGRNLELICVDGGYGLHAALPVVFPAIPVQLCWAHKTRNILDKVKDRDREAVRKALHRISHARNLVQARRQARIFATTWEPVYPKAVACLRQNLDLLLAFLRFDDPDWRKATRTTNAIERKFVEVRRRTRPMGVFSDSTSIERILYAVFTNENINQGFGAPFATLTHNS